MIEHEGSVAFLYRFVDSLAVVAIGDLDYPPRYEERMFERRSALKTLCLLLSLFFLSDSFLRLLHAPSLSSGSCTGGLLCLCRRGVSPCTLCTRAASFLSLAHVEERQQQEEEGENEDSKFFSSSFSPLLMYMAAV